MNCLAAIPDEIDYGMIVVNRDAAVQYRNRAAHREPPDHRALSVARSVLRVHDLRQAQAVDGACRAAADRGIRRIQEIVARMASLPPLVTTLRG